MWHIVAISLWLSRAAFAAEPDHVQRIEARITIGDHRGAETAAETALDAYPDSFPVVQSVLKVRALKGSIKDLVNHFNVMKSSFPEQSLDPDLIETLCWGIVNKSSHSLSLPTQAAALFAVSQTRDARALPLLLRGLDSPNVVIRSLATHLSTGWPDQIVKERLLKLFKHDTSYPVRQLACATLGRLKADIAVPALESVLSDEAVSREEHGSALIALANIYEEVEGDKLRCLASHPSRGMRRLAAHLIGHFERHDALFILQKLLSDSSEEVVGEAIRAMAFMRAPNLSAYRQLAQHPSPRISLSAIWAICVEQEDHANLLDRHLNSTDPEILYPTLTLLTQANPEAGLRFAVQSHDPFAKVNIALTLIQKGVHLEKGCEMVHSFIKNLDTRIMEKMVGPFSVLVKGSARHTPHIPRYPDQQSLMTQLRLLAKLAILGYPNASQAIEQFIEDRSEMIGGMAAIILLQEGKESILSELKNGLKDVKPNQRVQNALILALMRHDKDITKVLEEEYSSASPALREKILVGIGQVANKASIPFLLDVITSRGEELPLLAAIALLHILES